jgi:hypothetical protein
MRVNSRAWPELGTSHQEAPEELEVEEAGDQP